MEKGAADFTLPRRRLSWGTACRAARHEKRVGTYTYPQLVVRRVTQMWRQVSLAAAPRGGASQYHTSLIHCAMSTLRFPGFDNQG